MTEAKFDIYRVHQGYTGKMLPVDTLGEARDLAACFAQARIDGLLRVFGPEGFVTAYSVLDGDWVEHPNVTIPSAHW